MQYPTLLEYMKAIQDAGANLDKLAHLSVVLDGQGEPYHISGDSSVVFKMLDKTTGKCYALKCFTKAQKGCADASSNSSSVKFLEKELLVQSQGKEEKYPVLLMDWVDGDSLGACQLKVEDMSTVATKAELNEAITDEFGVKYSKDGRKLLKVPQKLKGTYAIKEGTKIICNMVFCECDSLNSVVIPDGVAVIGNDAFSYCESLKSIIIPDSVTSIGESAFEGCSSLTRLVLPDSVTSIRNSSFWGCSSLSSLVIPDGVTSIGNGAFADCSSLKNLVLPESVVSINGNLFCKWNGEVKCLSPNFIFEDGVLFNKDKSTIISFRDKDITSYVIPDYVTSIGGDAFSGCESLTSLVIPDSVTCIGNRAFEFCFSLKSLVLSKSLTSIGDWAFNMAESLESLVIPDSVTSIGDYAFSGCRSLKSLVISNSVTHIAVGAFLSCTSLSSVVIPDGVTRIGEGAFIGCESLKSIVIPDGVVCIEKDAFRDCNFPNDFKQELISRFGDKIFG